MLASSSTSLYTPDLRSGEPCPSSSSASFKKSLLNHSQVNLHLYGKKEARPGRKMGHFTVTGDDREEVLAIAERLFKGLLEPDSCSTEGCD